MIVRGQPSKAEAVASKAAMRRYRLLWFAIVWEGTRSRREGTDRRTHDLVFLLCRYGLLDMTNDEWLTAQSIVRLREALRGGGRWRRAGIDGRRVRIWNSG